MRLKRANANALRIGGSEAQEMMAGSPSGMNEGVASEGGFFLAPEVLPGVIEPVYTEDPILSRVTRIPIGNGTNRTVYNVVDESSRTDGNRWGGIQMYWGDEADTAAAKKPKLRQVEQLLKKLIGIGYLTDEQLEDTPQAQTLLTKAFQAELQFMLASGIFRGPGGGQMLGFLKGKGVVRSAIEAGQTIANTPASISFNVAKMKANIPASLWPDLVFLYNQELLPDLMNATLGGTSMPACRSGWQLRQHGHRRHDPGSFRPSRRSSASSGRHAGRHRLPSPRRSTTSARRAVRTSPRASTSHSSPTRRRCASRTASTASRSGTRRSPRTRARTGSRLRLDARRSRLI
jgi:hypothetical protein